MMNLLLGAIFACTAFAAGGRGASGNALFAQDATVDGYNILATPGHEPLDLDFASLAEVGYTTLSHSAFPNHSVRITRAHGFCDTTVKAYSGYVDVEARHLFFYFFESRNDPATDDVVMWINGGPGGSSSMGLLMELGPCNIKSANTTEFNPYSWNTNANMIFLDQPVGVGFSYADHGEVVSTTEEAAKDVAAFFAILSNSFPQYQGRTLHLAGESYGGHYLPIFAAEIYDQNPKLVEMGMAPVNLTSIVLVNGLTSIHLISESYYDMLCTSVSGLMPVMPISVCTRMKQALPRCKKMLHENCYESHDQMNCVAADIFCNTELLAPFMNTGRNPYDISKLCEGEYMDTFCYPESKAISLFLNANATRKTLGTDAQPTVHKGVNFDVFARFAATGDIQRDATPYVGQLLDRGVRVLIFAGAYDLGCSWIGNERTSRALAWHGKEAFGAQELREWEVDGEKAGKTRSWGALTFASVYGAGHMAPHDKPRESLALINRWLAGKTI